MEKTTVDKIKWQIHAETSITQIMLWIIIAKLFEGWLIFAIAIVYIIGNVYVLLKSVSKLGKDYFKFNV